MYRNLSPSAFKKMLLTSKATAECLQINAHENKDDLQQLARTIRSSSAWLPAVGVALTMHNHIVLACKKFPSVFKDTQIVLEYVRQSTALVASAFAEGVPGSSILDPGLHLSRKDNRIFINGSKKPCTLASIADYFVLSAKEDDHMKLLLLTRKIHNCQIIPYWKLDILTECDNQELRLTDAEISPHDVSDFEELQQQKVISYGLCLFNYFAAHTYCGALDGLIRQLPARVAESQTVSYALAQAAIKIDVLLEQMLDITNHSAEDMSGIPRILSLRYILENVIEETARIVLRCCGGVQVMTNTDVFYFYTIVQFYKFHPVSEFQFLNSADNNS